MSLDDESITAHPEPRYQLRSNTQSFEPISLSSRSSRRYHQTSTTPSSSSTTPTKKSSSGYTTSIIHQSPFGGANQWGTPAAAPTFTPSSYSAASRYVYTHIHHGGQQFLWENWEVQRKARYHFFEGVQGNFLNCGLWTGVQVWR